VPFPENPPVVRMQDYDHLRPYLHSRRLRWSYGAVRGRPGDAWQQQVTSLPVEELVLSLQKAGFQGIYIDRFGYADDGMEMESKLTSLTGAPPLESADKRLMFFRLGQGQAAASLR